MRPYFNETMVAGDNAGEDGIAFALGAGANNDNLIFRVFIDVVNGNHGATVNFDVAELFGDFNIRFHAKAVKGHFFSNSSGIFENVPDPFYL